MKMKFDAAQAGRGTFGRKRRGLVQSVVVVPSRISYASSPSAGTTFVNVHGTIVSYGVVRQRLANTGQNKGSSSGGSQSEGTGFPCGLEGARKEPYFTTTDTIGN